MKQNICITVKEFQKAAQIFNASDYNFIPVNPDEHLLSQAIKQHKASHAIVGVEPYTAELYAVLPRGGVVARFGVGHDGIDKVKATQAGLFVTNTPGVLDDSVAEHAVMLIGCFARNISQHDSDMKDNKWQPAIGTELKGKTLLVLGCGPIGRKTAKIASFGFEMNVIGCDVAKVDKEQLRQNYGFNDFAVKYEDVIAQADYISIHIPSIPATKHFVGKVFLSKLRKNCVIINTARGPVVDEIALYDALKSKQIAGAALDVFENEPFVPVNPEKDLRTLDNVILTPHVGSSTVEACCRMAHCVLANLTACVEKRFNDMNIVNPEILETLK